MAVTAMLAKMRVGMLLFVEMRENICYSYEAVPLEVVWIMRLFLNNESPALFGILLCFATEYYPL